MIKTHIKNLVHELQNITLRYNQPAAKGGSVVPPLELNDLATSQI